MINSQSLIKTTNCKVRWLGFDCFDLVMMGWITFKTMTRLFSSFFSLLKEWGKEMKKDRERERENKERQTERERKDIKRSQCQTLRFSSFSSLLILLSFVLSFLLFSSLSSWINHIGNFSSLQNFSEDSLCQKMKESTSLLIRRDTFERLSLLREIEMRTERD